MSRRGLLLAIGFLLALAPRPGHAAPTASDWNLVITSGLPAPGTGSNTATIGTATGASDAFVVNEDDPAPPPAPIGAGSLFLAVFRPESTVPSFAHFLDVDLRAPVLAGATKTWYLKVAPDPSMGPATVGLNWDPTMIPSDLTVQLSQLAGAPTATGMPAVINTVDMSKAGQLTYAFAAGGAPTFFAVTAKNNRLGVTITAGPAAGNITPNSVTISWTTDVPASSIVRFGTTTQFGVTQQSADLSTSHSITLTNLSPGTTYHYQVSSGGAANRDPVTTQSDLTFTTTAIPIQISNIQTSVLSNSFTVTWTTDLASDSEITYAAAGGLPMVQQDPKLTISHSVTVTGLQASTQYTFLIGSKAPAMGAAGQSPIQMIMTTAAGGFTVNPSVVAGANSATVTWSTSVPTDGRVEFGVDASYGHVVADVNPPATSHSVLLTGLASGTTYHYHVISSGTGVGPLDSGDLTFKTLASAVQFLQAPTVTQLTSHSATISWTTDVSSSTVVNYGTQATLGTQATGADGTSHTVVIDGLLPGTLYHFQAVSSAAGHTDATTGDMTFTTLLPLRITVQPAVAAGGLTATSALIAWQTDQPASSVVNYSTDTSLSQVANGADNTTNHRVQLTGLKPNTTYHVRVTSSATGRDTVVVDGLQFTTNPQVMILTGPQTTHVTSTGATIIWTTDVASDSLVDFGLDTGYGHQARVPDLVTSHSVVLSNLAPGTTVHYRVTSTAAGLDPAVSKDQMVSLPLVPVKLLSGPTATPSVHTTTITWTTDAASDSQVEYGTSPTYGASTRLSDLVTTHTVVLTGLSANTEYHFRVDSSAPGAAVFTSTDNTFTTAAPTAGATQILTGPSIQVTSSTTAVVIWTTDAATDSVVQFGPTVAYGQTAANGSPVMTHQVVLISLTPGAEYHYQVSSGAANSSRTQSADDVFNTLATSASLSFTAGFNVTDVANDNTGRTVDQMTNPFAVTNSLLQGIAIDSRRGILYIARGNVTNDDRANGTGGVDAILVNSPLAKSVNPNAGGAASNYTDTGLITAANNPNGLGFAQGVAYDPVSDMVYVAASSNGSPSATPTVFAAPGGTVGGAPNGGNVVAANAAFTPLFVVTDDAGAMGAALGGSNRGIAVHTISGTTWVYLAMGQHADVWTNSGGAWHRAWSSDLFPADGTADHRLGASDTGVHAVAVDAVGNSYWSNSIAPAARAWQFPASASGAGLEFDDFSNGGSSKGPGRPVEFRNDSSMIAAAEFRGVTGLAVGGDDQPLFVALLGSGSAGRTVARARFVGDPSAPGDTVPARVVDGFGGGVPAGAQDPTLATLTLQQPSSGGVSVTQPPGGDPGLLYLTTDPATHTLWVQGFVKDASKGQSVPTAAAFEVAVGPTPAHAVVIGAPQVSNVTANSATVSWTLEQPAAANVVEFGTTPAYGQQVPASGPTATPTATLTGLTPNTRYHFRVSSGAAGDLTTSADLIFMTAIGVLKGDISGRGSPVPRVADITKVLRAVLGLGTPLTPDQAFAADVAPLNADGTRGDGRVNVADASVLLQAALGLIHF